MNWKNTVTAELYIDWLVFTANINNISYYQCNIIIFFVYVAAQNAVIY
jgi:hypothetical protein